MIGAVAGMVILFAGIFLLVLGSLTEKTAAVAAAAFAIPGGLGILGWSVVARNRNLR